jgi:hypothetical protein
MSVRRTFKKLTNLSTPVTPMKLAAGIGLIVAAMATFAACSSGRDGIDQSSAQSTNTLPDWTNDPTKYRPK